MSYPISELTAIVSLLKDSKSSNGVFMNTDDQK